MSSLFTYSGVLAGEVQTGLGSVQTERRTRGRADTSHQRRVWEIGVHCQY